MAKLGARPTAGPTATIHSSGVEDAGSADALGRWRNALNGQREEARKRWKRGVTRRRAQILSIPSGPGFRVEHRQLRGLICQLPPADHKTAR